MSGILTEILTLLVSGLTTLGTGIGEALSEMVGAIFINDSGAAPALSTFGGIVVIFAGISLAFGLCRWVTNFITSLGARN